MKRLTVILAMGLLFTLTGCETMKGLGKDIQKAGQALEKKADE
ncbi:MAG: entericidin A/B family lipoprotein [Gammaproteobacteria bacterium]|nr:entericidin A/B family lipoprotein [Gammaproteobacteria bacterium]